MLIGVILRNLRVLKEENVVFAIFQSFFLDGVHLSSRLQAIFKTTVYVVYIGSSTIIFKMLPVSVAEWESAFKVFFLSLMSFLLSTSYRGKISYYSLHNIISMSVF